LVDERGRHTYRFLSEDTQTFTRPRTVRDSHSFTHLLRRQVIVTDSN